MRKDVGGIGGWMLLWEGVGCEGCPAGPASAPGIPRSFRSAHSRPLTLKRRGQGGFPPARE